MTWRSVLLLMVILMSFGRAAGEIPMLTERTIFQNGVDGHAVYRIPAIVRSNDGTLLAFAEGRAGHSDGGNIDIVLKRSADHGKTWGPLITAQGEAGNVTIGNPAPVVDRTTGHVHLLFCRNNDRVFHSVSEDHGVTWSERVEITSAVKRAGWGWYATGPVHGIQLTRGAQAGRLVIAANHRIGRGAIVAKESFGGQILFSDDHGATWEMEAVFEAAPEAAPNESTLVELLPAAPQDGSRVYVNSRDYSEAVGKRSEAWSNDGGSSYAVSYRVNPHFVTPVCQGSLLRYSSTDEGDAVDRILFSSPNDRSVRYNGGIWISTDEAETWSEPKLIRGGEYAYSDLVRTGDDHLGVIFETGPNGGYDMINFIRANEAWLDEPPAPAPPDENPNAALWNFEETPVGQKTSTAKGLILDLHPDENDLHLTAQSEFISVAGAPNVVDGRAIGFRKNGGLRLTDSESRNSFDYGPDDSFTIELMFRVPASAEGINSLVAKDLGGKMPSWWLRVEPTGVVRFLISDDGTESIVVSPGSVKDGEWHHLAAVRDVEDPLNRRLRLFIDRELVSEAVDETTGSLANHQTLWVGRFNAAKRDLTGDIDWLRITPSPLVPADFASWKTQFDADGDGIPDDFERAQTGSLTKLGREELLSFALGQEPIRAEAPSPTVAIEGNSIEVTTRQRTLPEWLSLQLSVSEDLREWQVAESLVSLTPIAHELWLRTDRIDFLDEVPNEHFFRYELHDQP